MSGEEEDVETSRGAFYDREYSTRETLGRVFKLAAHEKRRMIILTLIFTVLAGVGIALPLCTMAVVNELAMSTADYAKIRMYGWAFFIGTAVEWMLLYVMIRIEWTIIARTTTKLRMDMFTRLQEHDLSFYDKTKTGKTMSRVMDDTWQIGNLILIFAEFFTQFLLLAAILFVMFYKSWEITLGVLIIIPVIVGFMVVFGIVIRKYARICRRTVAAVNSAMQESVSGVSVAKGFSREAKSRTEFVHLNDENLKWNLRRGITFATIFPFINFTIVLSMFIIIYHGGGYVISGDIEAGDLYLFYLLTMRLFGPVISLSQQFAMVQQGMAATERIFSLLDHPSVMRQGTEDPGVVEGSIEFKDVTFGYTPETTLFEDLNLRIEQGENIALVGHTGAGKTSIVSLLARFYEIQGGDILVDGKSLKGLDLDLYRRNIGIVLQDPYLFAGTIRDNIRYGKPEASEEDIQQAMELSQLKEFVEFLPEGLETDVHERGSRLSTGQRQLVSFARALVADPRILILDEATASVDAYTESMIQTSLANLLEGRTSIVVAHRLSTILKSDRILVFDHGKIVGDAPHAELLKTNEVYKSLYKTYYEYQGISEQIVLST